MPNDINAPSLTALPLAASPAFSLGVNTNCLGVISLVNSTGEVVRRWRLQNTKSTIGSDRQATIWLDDHKVSSFHALLVLGSTNCIIKSFGPGLRLNGQTVQESSIRAGDRFELLGYQFLIESLSVSNGSSKSVAKVPDATPALDSAHVCNPHETSASQASATIDAIQVSKLEVRVDQLLTRLSAIDEKISQTSAEQKNDFSQKCESLRTETEHLRETIAQDFSIQIRNLTSDIERQNSSRELKFDTKLADLSKDFQYFRAKVENGVENLQRADQVLAHLAKSQEQTDSRLTNIEQSQQQSSAHFEQLERWQRETTEKIDSLYQQSNQRLASIEDVEQNSSVKTDASSENHLASIKPEIAALQARLSDLEEILGDLAATMQTRGPVTERFQSDVTTPYRSSNNDRDFVRPETPAFEAEPEPTSAQATELPAWFRDGLSEELPEETEADNEAMNSPLFRESIDDDDRSAPVAQWSTANSLATPEESFDASEDQADEKFNEDLQHNSILHSLLRQDTEEPSDSSADTPMFDQKDWEESDSYLESDRSPSVSALDILRASYGSKDHDRFEDDESAERVESSAARNSNPVESAQLTEDDSNQNTGAGQAEHAAPVELKSYRNQAASGSNEGAVKTPAASSNQAAGSSARNQSHSSSDAARSDSQPAGDEDSVEAYMQRLLARMRGGEAEPEKPAASAPMTVSRSSLKPSGSQAMRTTYSPLRKTRQDPAAALIASRPKVEEEGAENDGNTGDPNVDNSQKAGNVTAPRSAPESASDLAALRELANDSARASVKPTGPQIKPVSSTVKLIVASLACAFGIILLVGNGLRVNLTLVAAATSFMLAAIWLLDLAQSYVNSKKQQQSSTNNTAQVQKKLAGKK